MAKENNSTQLSIGRIASLACLLEVCAPKPGNVHRGADFEDMSLNDFVVSAELLGQAIDSRKTDELGLLVLNATRATQSLVSVNTNLGIILLVCPLTIAANDGDLSSTAVRRLLKETGPEDAANIFTAIRSVNPGGLGDTDQMDVNEQAPESILDAMAFSVSYTHLTLPTIYSV